MYKVTLLITTYNRDELLNYGLHSITRQGYQDVEIIVINDGTPDRTQEMCEHYGVKYLFTGQRNLNGGMHWRIPGYAFNIGVKQAQSDIIILSCAEMYHINNCIDPLILPTQVNKMSIGQPDGKQDLNGSYLALLQTGQTPNNYHFKKCGKLKCHLPFLLSVHKDVFMDIGGYDEDFTGQAYDDDDIIDRLKTYGCMHIETKAQVVHLYHTRDLPGRQLADRSRWRFNKQLFESRRGLVKRNLDKEWGVL